jgi:hypothetical protein
MRFLEHTQVDTHTADRIPLDDWSARSRGRYLHDTQHKQERNSHALSRIRNCDLINRAAIKAYALGRTDNGIGAINHLKGEIIMTNVQKYNFHAMENSKFIDYELNSAHEG